MVNGSRYYSVLKSVSIASALSTALTIYPCQIRVHQTLTVLNSNFLQLGRSGGRPQRTVYPRRLPVMIHSTLAGIEPTTFRLLVQRATSRATGVTRATKVVDLAPVESAYGIWTIGHR